VRRRRELRGLTRLVHTEIVHNHMTLETFYSQPKRVVTRTLSAVRTETWESVRVQLAEMMPADDFGALAYYYLFLQELQHILLIAEGRTVSDTVGLTKNLLEALAAQEPDAREVSLAYANLGGLLGWRRMRRRISEHRRHISESKASDEPSSRPA
jgi:hypothetical protein